VLSLQATLFQTPEEVQPALGVFLYSLDHAQNLAVAILADADSHQHRHVRERVPPQSSSQQISGVGLATYGGLLLAVSDEVDAGRMLGRLPKLRATFDALAVLVRIGVLHDLGRMGVGWRQLLL